MEISENYRLGMILDAYAAGLQRIGFLATNGAGPRAIAEEVERIEEFVLALNAADSDTEIDALLRRKAY
jgi:hypothetical protein